MVLCYSSHRTLIHSLIPTPGNYLRNFSEMESKSYRCATDCNNYAKGKPDTQSFNRLIFQDPMSDIYYFTLEKV